MKHVLVLSYNVSTIDFLFARVKHVLIRLYNVSTVRQNKYHVEQLGPRVCGEVHLDLLLLGVTKTQVRNVRMLLVFFFFYLRDRGRQTFFSTS